MAYGDPISTGSTDIGENYVQPGSPDYDYYASLMGWSSTPEYQAQQAQQQIQDYWNTPAVTGYTDIGDITADPRTLWTGFGDLSYYGLPKDSIGSWNYLSNALAGSEITPEDALYGAIQSSPYAGMTAGQFSLPQQMELMGQALQQAPGGITPQMSQDYQSQLGQFQTHEAAMRARAKERAKSFTGWDAAGIAAQVMATAMNPYFGAMYAAGNANINNQDPWVAAGTSLLGSYATGGDFGGGTAGTAFDPGLEAANMATAASGFGTAAGDVTSGFANLNIDAPIEQIAADIGDPTATGGGATGDTNMFENFDLSSFDITGGSGDADLGGFTFDPSTSYLPQDTMGTFPEGTTSGGTYSTGGGFESLLKLLGGGGTSGGTSAGPTGSSTGTATTSGYYSPLAGMMGGIYDYNQLDRTSSMFKDIMAQSGTIDPYQQYRSGEAALRNQTFTDPLSIYASEPYQLLDQRMQDQQLAGAAQAGTLYNAPERLAQRQTGFLDYLSKMRADLLPGSGAGMSPATDEAFLAEMAKNIAPIEMAKSQAVGQATQGGLQTMQGMLPELQKLIQQYGGAGI